MKRVKLGRGKGAIVFDTTADEVKLKTPDGVRIVIDLRLSHEKGTTS